MPTETALEELIPGARNAVETCLAIQPGERVTLITDRPSEEVAASLARAIEMRGASCEEFLLEDLAPRTRAETNSRFARTRRCWNPVHESDARRTGRAQRYRGRRRAPPDSLCAHGR